MITLGPDITDLRKSAALFAGKEISTRPNLNSLDEFPPDLWRKMADEKLLGLAVPLDFGGLGGGYLAITAVGESLVESGRSLGVALSWMIHQVISRFFILGFGSERQCGEYLPELAKGALTACLAVSEPGVGAHPARLKTSASFTNGIAVLTGEKTFLTNGPLAGLFVVIAVTGGHDGRKEFSAFLVPKDAAGLSLTEPLPLNILKPSPHCGIRLVKCRVPETALLGRKGTAYSDMVIPFRDVEDVLIAGPAVGAMKAQMEMVISEIRVMGTVLSEELKTELGGLESLLHALRASIYEAARCLDIGKWFQRELLPLVLSFRPLARDFQSRLSRLAIAAGLGEEPERAVLTRDIAAVINLANNVARIKQRKIGEALLSGKD